MNHKSVNAFRPSGRLMIRWLIVLNCLAVLGTSLFFRVWRLDHVPGVNGDEAWLGVQALRWLHGEAVTWRTPTDNPINPFHWAPQVLLHAVLPPSITVLRLPVLISGILALGLNYVCCRRALDETTAVVSTLILAVLPINIAYSRFAWDASQSVLFTIPVIYGALLMVRFPRHRAAWLCGSLVALTAALLVHPTNIFVTPLVIVAAGYSWRDAVRAGALAARHNRKWQFVWLSCVAGGVLLVWLLWPWVVLAARRAAWLPQYGQFFVAYLDLFSGTTVFRYIAGGQMDSAATSVWLYRLAVAAVFGFAGYGIWRSFAQDQDRCETRRAVYLGAATSAAVFFLIAGPGAMAPAYERYAMCLIVPGALLLAGGCRWWCDHYRKTALVCCLAAAWLLLVAHYVHYFQVFEKCGGRSHRTFRTATVEPKRQAVLRVAELGIADQPQHVVATEWWTYWPLAYLAYGDPGIRVRGSPEGDAPFGEAPPASNVASLADAVALTDGRVYFVDFVGAATHDTTQRQLRAAGYRLDRKFIADAAGRPFITIVRPVAP